MALLRHNLVSFFFIIVVIIIIIPFVVSYRTSSPDDPLNIYVEDNSSPLKNLIKQSVDSFRSNRFTKLGVTSSVTNVNVNDYGAKGDGKTDDTEAFKKAWEVACSSEKAVVNVLVPQNKYYLVKPITFSGPCKSDNIALQVSGTIEASENPSDYSEDTRHWLKFESIEKLTVQGGGTINGNGNIWWQNSCKRNPKLPCKNAPTAVTFYKCSDLIVENLAIKNAQQIHVNLEDCINVRVSEVTVSAPQDSPNTDGIHVTNTQNIRISTSLIATGDDCLSIESGTHNLLATGITCGPGHGISIGSLGETGSSEFVSGITVNGAKISGTTNGVRIKTWQGGSGSASNIKFQNIEMENVRNPIIIDQNYCDQDTPCKQQKSGVEVKNVLYENIKGTSGSEVGVSFNCSQSVPCEGIMLHNVQLTRQSRDSPSLAICQSASLSYVGQVSPRCP